MTEVINPVHYQSLSDWELTAILPEPVYSCVAVTTHNRVYLLGGFRENQPSCRVLTAPIAANGALGVWSAASDLPCALTQSKAVVYQNRAYLIGGHNGSASSSEIYTASILEDGALSDWTATETLPVPMIHPHAVASHGHMYLVSGVVGGEDTCAVYSRAINPDGSLGEWKEGPSLPDPIGFSQVIAVQNRIYLIGGYVNDVPSCDVFMTSIGPDGSLSPWSKASPLPKALDSHRVSVVQDRVYLLGGYDEDGPCSDVFTSTIASDGTLGDWRLSTSLPDEAAFSQVVNVKDRLYLLGGYSAGTAYGDVYCAVVQ